MSCKRASSSKMAHHFIAGTFLFLNLIPSLVSSSTFCSSSSPSFSFDADPYHVDALAVVDCRQSPSHPLDSPLPNPLPHDVILDSRHIAASSDSTASSASKSSFDWIPGNHFHRLDPDNVVLRARSGPFEASARVKTAKEEVTTDESDKKTETSSPSSVHVTAHPIAHALRRDEPVVRALFHATSRRHASCFDHLGQTDECKFDRHVCVVGRSFKEGVDVGSEWLSGSSAADASSLTGSCVVESDVGKSTGCLMQIVVPTNWWLSSGKTDEFLNNGREESFVNLTYEAFYVDDVQKCHGRETIGDNTLDFNNVESHQSESTPSQQTSQHESRIDLIVSDVLRIPMTPLGADGTAAPPDSNDAVQPRSPLDNVYRGAIIHVPVTVDIDAALEDSALENFVVKAKVKRGLKIIGAEVSAEGDTFWRTNVRSRGRNGASITISASRRRSRRSPRNRPSKRDVVDQPRAVLATVVFEAADDSDFFSEDLIRVTWTTEFGNGSKRNTSQTVFRASRDSVQALVPVIKTKRLLNTALVDGNAIVEPMRVYAVSFTGDVQDISAKATCHSQSRDSLKVSSSCENVYLDGSETHGFSEVTILAKYTHYLGYTTVAVWVPRLPLEIVVSDRKLSQIRGWKVPRQEGDVGDPVTNDAGDVKRQKQPSKIPCALKYQEANIRVLARFLTDGAAVSDVNNVNAGSRRDNVKWLLDDGVSVDVTWRVKTDLRIVDPRLARIKKLEKERRLILVGMSPGFAKLHVVSPFTGRVLAATEVEIAAFDRVDMIGTRVSLLTGLNLLARRQRQSHRQKSIPILSASLTTFRRFHAVGHKGFLEIQLLFSDGTAFALGDVSPEEYTLVVNSLDTDVIAISTASSTSSSSSSSSTDSIVNPPNHVPTLVATGEGSGDFIFVSVDSPESCIGKRKQLGESVKDLVLSPSLTSDYVPVTVGDGLTPEYDLAYSEDWMGGDGAEFDGFLNDGNFNGYGDRWGIPLGVNPGAKSSAPGDVSQSRSYAYQEFSNLGAAKESHNRKRLFSDGKSFGVKREETFSPFREYDFDRWDTRNIQDPQDLFLPGVSEKRAVAPSAHSISKTEVALYVLLGVLAVAVAVLAAHCAVHHVNRKRVVRIKSGHTSASSSSRRTATPNAKPSAFNEEDDDDDSATEDASEDFARAEDFVWMSKEALEEADIPVECTQRLMPDADFVAQTLRRDLPPHHPGKPSAVASLSRGNSRTGYANGSRCGTQGSLPIAAHHRGSLPECNHRSRASSVASSGSRMSRHSAASTTDAGSPVNARRHLSDSFPNAVSTDGHIGDDRAFIDADVAFRNSGSASPPILNAASVPRNSAFVSSTTIIGKDDGDSMKSSRSGVSTKSSRSGTSLLSVTLNPMDDLLQTSKTTFDDGANAIPPSASNSAASNRGCPAIMESSATSSVRAAANSPFSSSISASMAKRCSPAMSTSPPSSPGLSGSPPGSPLMSSGSRRLLKQDSVTSTNSNVLGSICYDYRERGLSFDQMVQYFDHLDETPT